MTLHARRTDTDTHHLGTVLVTGAGGAAAVTLIRSLRDRATVVAADIDPIAAGLYLVPAEQRLLLPRGDDPGFVAAVLAAAVAHDADLVVPTVDIELRGVSAARERFAAQGCGVLVESVHTLDLCLDKAALVEACRPVVRVPVTLVLTPDLTPAELDTLGAPFVAKPRSGSGGRGFEVVTDRKRLLDLPRDGSMLLQELLPGEEYSIDVLADDTGHVVAAVPRARDKVDSGIAVAGRTLRDGALESFGRAVATAIDARGVVNVQARRARNGLPTLLEVNPRFPGTMPLTVAAGVDMPLLAVEHALGHPLPDRIAHREVAVVRHWEDVVVPMDEYAFGRTPGEWVAAATASS